MNITPKQREVLDYIMEHQVKFRVSPTLVEIARGVDLHSPATVCTHLDTLQEKGFIRRERSGRRSIEVLPQAQPIERVLAIERQRVCALLIIHEPPIANVNELIEKITEAA